VDNYVTDMQLHFCYFWNKYCEQLANLYKVNRNRKCWVVNATYNTRCHKE